MWKRMLYLPLELCEGVTHIGVKIVRTNTCDNKKT